MHKKYVVLILIFSLFSCAKRKDILSLYFTNDLSQIIWQENNGILSLRNVIEKDKIDKTFIDLGGELSSKMPENTFDRYNDFIKIARICDISGVNIDYSSLNENVSFLFKNKEYGSLFLSTNLYFKNKDAIYVSREIENPVYLISALVPKITEPQKHEYFKEYRIENPIYEINRNLIKVKNVKKIKILILNFKDFDLKSNKKDLYNLIDQITCKPEIIIINNASNEKNKTNYFKPFKYKNIWITATLKEENIFKFALYEIPVIKLKKIRVEKVGLDKNYDNVNEEINKQILQIKGKKLSYFKKSISYLEKTANSEKQKNYTASLMAKAINSYIRSNISLFKNSALDKDLKYGEIKIKDIYEILSADDHLIYCKIKGMDLTQMLNSININDFSFSGLETNNGDIKINGEMIKKEKLYRVIMPQSVINDDVNMLSYSTEFSVLPKTTLDAALWFLRTHKKVSL
jgi:2',3'-cyclic-nucleotide 2'-phosphodiesterase (5'-nucleotidase family)